MRNRALMCWAAVGCLLVGACADGDRTGDGETISAVAGFYPLFEASLAVTGTGVEVENLTPAGTEPHDLELGPDEVDAIEDADVVVYLGGGFQPAVEEVAARQEGSAVDVLRAVPLVGTDPHVWLDPSRFATIVRAVGDAFAAVDDRGAASYHRNAAEYADRLTALDLEFQAGLQACARNRIVTSHAAFAYLADRYGLTQDAIAGVSPEAEPDPRRLAELADRVRRDGTTTIFSETLVSPRVAETLAREAGVTTAVLDPLEGLSPEQQRAGEDYFSVMRANLAALRQALGCA